MLLTAVFVRCSGQLSAHYGITKRVESLLQAIQYGQKISSVHHFRYEHSIWSKWRDSNSRPPVPEASRSSLLTTFICFLVLFSPKVMLSDALVRTVSTQSKSVDGQRCGQAEFSSKKPSHDYSKLIPSGD